MHRLGLIAIPVMLAGAAAPPRELVIDAADPFLPVTITGNGEGAKGRLIVDPGAPAMPMIDAAFAARAGLKAGPFMAGYRIGPVTVHGSSAVARIDLGTGPEKRRVVWTETPFAAGGDGAIGPGALNAAIVRFVLRPAAAGERSVALPMVDGGGLVGGRIGLFATVAVGDGTMRVRFDLRHPRSLATAGAAAALADAFGGALTGEPSRAEVAFGVERPIRAMTLARPLVVGPLSLTRIDVRTADFGSAAGIRDGDVASDPDEIVVTAKGKRDRSHDRLTLGTDALARCSSIVFDKPAKVVRLTCA